MADTLGLSDVSSKDTGRGSQLKTGGGRRKHNMPSKEVCAKKFGSGTKAYRDCVNYKVDPTTGLVARVQRMRRHEGPKPKKKKPKFKGGKPGRNY